MLIGPVSHDVALSFTKSAAALVVTSHSESLPTAVMEARAMEQRVIVPNSSGCRDLVEDGTTGFVYEPGSLCDLEAQLTRSLETVSTDRAARSVIEDAYTWSRVSARLDQLYTSLTA